MDPNENLNGVPVVEFVKPIICCCTNQCPQCGQCCAVGCEHRGMRSYDVTSDQLQFLPVVPTERDFFQKEIYDLETRQKIAIELLESLVSCRKPRKKQLRQIIRVLKGNVASD